jgi:formate hydrogenlyase transcriptional activator
MLERVGIAEYHNDYNVLETQSSDGRANFINENVPPKSRFTEIIGESAPIKALLQAIETVAPTDATVLILGETGTGKELVAKAIHRLSRRANRNFVRLNSAAVPSTLLEAELFGHEKGAFTGATVQRIGRFELANNGTLFLDEIGDLSLELQPKLLRVLQEQEFERLGSSRTIKTDVRMVTATHQDLLDKVEEGEFRLDLYYRLNIFPVRIPPLRERKGDIPLLANHFAQKFATKMGKMILPIPKETLKVLCDCDYPGNVRQLENIIERAVILSNDGHLWPEFVELKTLSKKSVFGNEGTLEDFERKFILQALTTTGWCIGGPNGAAARLGLKRTTLVSKMGKLGISRSRT